jgi:hypothetical protein
MEDAKTRAQNIFSALSDEERFDWFSGAQTLDEMGHPNVDGEALVAFTDLMDLAVYGPDAT